MPEASLMEASENKGRKCVYLIVCILILFLKFYKTVTMSVVKRQIFFVCFVVF